MTAALQPETKSPSRRALLAGALGGIGALAATVIGRADPVRANDPNDVVLGTDNTATTRTSITNYNNLATVFLVENATDLGGGGGIAIEGKSGSSSGVLGNSTSGVGVQGNSVSSVGVVGRSTAASGATFGALGRSESSAGIGVGGRGAANSTGVAGYSGTGTFPAAKSKTGVYGYAAQDNASQGVWGHSPAGNGVVGSTSTGYAGYFSGKVYSTAFYELSEIGTPAAPAPNRARLFVKDNGAGKTQLCVRFHTGAVKVIVTEP